MVRLIRLLPVLLPVFRAVLRNSAVRKRLGMRPLDDKGKSSRR